MNQCALLKFLGAVTAALTLSTCVRPVQDTRSPATAQQKASAAKAPQRPNILFCFADDWGRYARIYARVDGAGTINDVLRTPALDRIGREGVVFRHAFVPAPSCSPSRASVVTGMYFYRCGSHANLRTPEWGRAPNPFAQLPGFPVLLQQHGYHIGFTGKTVAGSKTGGGKTRFSRAGLNMNRWSQRVSAAEDKRAARAKILDEVRGNFRQFLAGRTADQPFLYWFGPHNLHRSWVRGSGKALWGIDPDALKGKLPAFLPDVPVVREDFADYLGEVQAWDAMIGALLEELERFGELDRTLIVLSGDHGMPGVPYGKCNVYDLGVHAPLLVRWGDRIQGGRVVDDFVNLMDLAPTFLASAGVDPPATMQARSFLDVLLSDKQGHVDPSRDHVIVGQERHVPNARAGNLPYPKRAIRTREFLYIRNFKPDRWPMGDPRGVDESEAPSFDQLASRTGVTFADMDASPTKAWLVTHRAEPNVHRYYRFAFGKRPAEELYDLRRDPHQVNNVATDARFTAVKARLAARLMKHLRQTGDPRVIGNGDAFDRPPYAADKLPLR